MRVVAGFVALVVFLHVGALTAEIVKRKSNEGNAADIMYLVEDPSIAALDRSSLCEWGRRTVAVSETGCVVPNTMTVQEFAVTAADTLSATEACNICLTKNAALDFSCITVGDGTDPNAGAGCSFANHDGDIDTAGEGCRALPGISFTPGERFGFSVQDVGGNCDGLESVQLYARIEWQL